MLSGKKDTVTKNKTKQQRRLLLHPLKKLHAQYNKTAKRHLKWSYRQVGRYCPFYVTPAKDTDRNTCACIDHENVKLLVEKLHQKGTLLTNSISELLAVIACNATSKQRMYRTCVKRCYSEIEFEGPLEETEITWQQWSRVVTSEEEKHFANFAKVTQSGKCEDLLALLNKKLDSLAKHHFNWLHQAKTLRELKETLREDEVCIHVDFSDTMAVSSAVKFRLSTSVAAANRLQSTPVWCIWPHHPAPMPLSLRHDERAVRAHMEPVLRDAIDKCITPHLVLYILSVMEQ